jgi:cytochrome c-type biogenesis protein CcmH/NrfG
VSRAIVEAEERLDEDPNDVEALRRLAEALVAEGDHVLAQEVYLDLVGLGPHDANALLGLASTAFASGDLPLARESAREAVRLAPDLAEARRLLDRLS